MFRHYYSPQTLCSRDVTMFVTTLFFTATKFVLSRHKSCTDYTQLLQFQTLALVTKPYCTTCESE